MKGTENMKEIKTYRKIDNVGRITIPKIMRDNLKLDCYDEVKLDMQENKIIITNESANVKEKTKKRKKSTQ